MFVCLFFHLLRLVWWFKIIVRWSSEWIQKCQWITNKNKAADVSTCVRVPVPLLLSLSLSLLFYVSRFVLLKIPLTGNVLFSIFFVWNKKKSKKKARWQRVNTYKYMCFLLPFLSLLKFFFSSPFSRLGDNSRRYQYTCTVWLLLSPVEDREEEEEKNRERKRNQRWTWHMNEREKWTRLYSSFILSIIAKLIHRFNV